MAIFLCLLKQNIPLGCKDNKQPLEILDIFCNKYSNFLSKAFPIICYRKVLYTKVTKVFPVIAIAIPHNSEATTHVLILSVYYREVLSIALGWSPIRRQIMPTTLGLEAERGWVTYTTLLLAPLPIFRPSTGNVQCKEGKSYAWIKTWQCVLSFL